MTSIPLGTDDAPGRIVNGDPEGEKQNPSGLAGTKLSPSGAQQVWSEVLEHKWYLSERSGRDVGLRAAARDYFENVRKVKRLDEIRDELSAPAATTTLPFMRPLGYR